MERSKKINVYFLSAVYLVLLVSIIFPHHHHEEIVCYTSTHCEPDDHSEGNTSEGLEDHHHDHNTSKESEQCISLEYYILAIPGKSFKPPVTCVEKLVFSDNLQSALLDSDCATDISYSCYFLCLKSHYTVFVKQHIPLRAPPAFLA